MKTNLRMLTLAVLLGLALVLTACGGGATGGATGGASGGTAAATTLDIGADGENLAFDKTTLTATATATAGQPVTVKFKNNSAVQQHNWVLVNGGEAVAKPINEGGLTAGVAADYLPADQANVLAHVKVLNGGETGEVSFTAPAAGTYTYICTVPGHFPLMQGTMTVN